MGGAGCDRGGAGAGDACQWTTFQSSLAVRARTMERRDGDVPSSKLTTAASALAICRRSARGDMPRDVAPSSARARKKPLKASSTAVRPSTRAGRSGNGKNIVMSSDRKARNRSQRSESKAARKRVAAAWALIESAAVQTDRVEGGSSPGATGRPAQAERTAAASTITAPAQAMPDPAVRVRTMSPQRWSVRSRT